MLPSGGINDSRRRRIFLTGKVTVFVSFLFLTVEDTAYGFVISRFERKSVAIEVSESRVSVLTKIVDNVETISGLDTTTMVIDYGTQDQRFRDYENQCQGILESWKHIERSLEE